ncbi:MAG: hypothetical protein QNI90_19115 [Dinoroseobacter sp.]|nr:hypothetical protein [Dinoroseobacter sp.]MDJ0995695.1 hypothetical protein [Dinoroseobacter sp.]
MLFLIRYACLLLVVFTFVSVPSISRADLVNLGGAEVAPNIAEFHINDDGVRVVLEVFIGDLPRFLDLVPADWIPESRRPSRSDRERLNDFAQNGLVIRTDDGEALQVAALTIERRLRIDRAAPDAGQIDPLSGRTLPAPPDDQRVLYAELFYAFDNDRPGTLTFSPPLLQDGMSALSLGMIAYQGALPLTAFRFLSAPVTLTLDWDDPWNSRFDNPNLVRHHRNSRMVFLYAEPYEIRQEALVRVRDAAELVGLEASTTRLEAEEAQALAEAAVDEIAARSRLTIEGQLATPDFDRGAFLRIGMRGLEFLGPGETVDVDAHILGLIWSAPVDGLPMQAQIEWDWFDETVPEVAAYSIDAAGPFLSPLTQDDPVLLWKNHFKVDPHPDVAAIRIDDDGLPSVLVYVLAGIGLCGAGLAVFGFVRSQTIGRMPTYAGFVLAVTGLTGAAFAINQGANRIPDLAPDELGALSEDLLNNVYRAFAFRTEAQVYDRLALTLHGDALEQVYLAQREALRIDRAGGAVARVTELDVREVTLQPAEPGGLRLQTDWTVTGRVGHWGHAHSRTNAYLADLVVAPVDGSWKILDFDVLREDRLQ